MVLGGLPIVGVDLLTEIRLGNQTMPCHKRYFEKDSQSFARSASLFRTKVAGSFQKKDLSGFLMDF